ncbi:hypothetical protein SAMN04487843_101180 [Methylobacterium sp. ap11]|nr:hypothetical protein SAMN04487843_101180 [Methylobacterium sp. ap11]
MLPWDGPRRMAGRGPGRAQTSARPVPSTRCDQNSESAFE